MNKIFFLVAFSFLSLIAIAQKPHRTIPDTPPSGPASFQISLAAQPDTLAVDFLLNGVSAHQADYLSGTHVTVAVQNIPDGFLFDHWSDGVRLNPRTIVLHGDSSLQAVFMKNPQLVNEVLGVCELTPGQVEILNKQAVPMSVSIRDVDFVHEQSLTLQAGERRVIALPKGRYRFVYTVNTDIRTITLEIK